MKIYVSRASEFSSSVIFSKFIGKVRGGGSKNFMWVAQIYVSLCSEFICDSINFAGNFEWDFKVYISLNLLNPVPTIFFFKKLLTKGRVAVKIQF